MLARCAFGIGKTFGIVALALVAGTHMASASDVDSVSSLGGSVVGLIGGISHAELLQLEQASAAEATISRLAAMEKVDSLLNTGARDQVAGVEPGPSESLRIARVPPAATAVASHDVDVFPISGRVVPLLVTRPVAEAAAAQPRLTLQSGLAETVGVTRSSLRSPTPRERDTR